MWLWENLAIKRTYFYAVTDHICTWNNLSTEPIKSIQAVFEKNPVILCKFFKWNLKTQQRLNYVLRKFTCLCIIEGKNWIDIDWETRH